jgi:TolB-like protein/cytochrome c-type biogenesis protein CcmH/NrfG
MSGLIPTAGAATASRAVFLSYAREDSPAALRITDALRSHGVEVWFDQSELRGGDAWDQKIRRQIRECALFMPIISASTHARGEGYFRLEWKLAVERTHLMAEGVPFLSPVVIDATPERDALVPAEFLRVQWNRLPGALPTPQFVEQVRRMLEAPAGRPSPSAPGAAPSSRSRGPGVWMAAALGVLAAAAITFVVLHRPPAAVALSPVDPKSIAVLPFENMSDEKENAYFTDGVHEDVLTNLSYLRDLHVVSRTSVMKYRSTTKSIREIGQELGVAYVLEGSVRREGNTVRVTGQLIDARTDEHVWAKAYDRNLTDIFAIQGELAQSIADALKAVLSPETKALIARRPTENTEAYDDYMKARSVNRDAVGVVEPAIARLRDAVRLDPHFAAAWAHLGGVLAYVHFTTQATDEVLKSATDAIDTAVRLAPDDPEVIESRGDFYYYGFRDYGRAVEQYLRLAEMRPNDPLVYRSLGLIQRRQGRWDDAIVSFEHSQKLDPTNTALEIPLVQCFFAMRRYDLAAAILTKTMEAEPDFLDLGWMMAWVRFSADGSVDAVHAFARRPVPPEQQSAFIYLQSDLAFLASDWTEFIRLRTLQRHYVGDTDGPEWGQDAFLAEAYAATGDMDTARARATEALAELEAERQRQPDNSVVWADLSLAHALLGHRQEALDCARKSSEMLPQEHDALLAPANDLTCVAAMVYAGEKDRALAGIARLLATPNVVSGKVNGLRHRFPTLQDDPRFMALMGDPANNAPFP